MILAKICRFFSCCTKQEDNAVTTRPVKVKPAHRRVYTIAEDGEGLSSASGMPVKPGHRHGDTMISIAEALAMRNENDPATPTASAAP